MPKIQFSQPKYVIPLIALPFVCLLFYGYKSFASNSPKEEAVQKVVKTDFINPVMPDAAAVVQDKHLDDKFGAYMEAMKGQKDLTAMQSLEGLDPNQQSYLSTYKDGELSQLAMSRKADSLRRALLATSESGALSNLRGTGRTKSASATAQGGSDLELLRALQGISSENDLASNKSYRNSRGGGDDKTSPYDEQMRVFRDQMRIVDSMSSRSSNSDAKKPGAAKSKNPHLVSDEPDSTNRPVEVSKYTKTVNAGFNTIRRDDRGFEIKAVIDEDITAQLGTKVRIRLLEDLMIEDRLLPKGTFIYGVVTGFQTQRINISIGSILLNNEPISVKMDVFDTDGYLGLYVPGSHFREVTKQFGTQASQGLSNIQTTNQTLTTRMADQAINTITTSTARMISKNKALLKFNYIIFLKNNRS